MMVRLEKPKPFRYTEAEVIEIVKKKKRDVLTTSYDFVNYIMSRQMPGIKRRQLGPEYAPRHLVKHELLRENPIAVGDLETILCSEWLDDQQVIFGTQCNAIKLYNVKRRTMVDIPTITPHLADFTDFYQTGVQSLGVNPERTYLATGATDSRDLALYSLPSMTPYCVGNGRTNSILDVCWLTNDIVLSAAADASIAMWRVPSSDVEDPMEDYMMPILSIGIQCEHGAVDYVTYNKRYDEVAALTENGIIHLFKAEGLQHAASMKGTCHVSCLAIQEDGILYAAASKTHTSTLDARTLQKLTEIVPPPDLGEILSMRFTQNLLTFGTDLGAVIFYDMRACDFIRSAKPPNESVIIKSSGEASIVSAIFTHCHDQSGTRMFAAGGPLTPGMDWGYAALWQ